MAIARWTSLGPAVAVGLALAAVPAGGQEAARLSTADRDALQNILEREVTGKPRRLPGGGTVTITATETRPRVCRTFRLESGGTRGEATGCRVGDARWDIGRPSGAVQAERPAVRPDRTVAFPLPAQKPGPPPAGTAARAEARTPDAVPLPTAKPAEPPAGPDFPRPAAKPEPG